MLISMTGFGRALHDCPLGRLIIEIQSINRKYLEIFVSTPKEFGRFEQSLRKWVQEKISRGQISLRIHLIPSPDSTLELLPDVETLKSLKEEWVRIAKSLGFDPESIDLPFLMLHSPIHERAQLAEDKDLQEIEVGFKEALEGLLKMKRNEGESLASDILGRITFLEKHLKKIEKLTPDSAKKMQEKLKEKIKEIKQEVDERVLKEVVLYAEKVDITEEITRLKSHFEQFQKAVQSSEPVGRKLDFLVQEMGREMNTIGSKSADSQISHLVVEMKSELEKIREQIQNIE